MEPPAPEIERTRWWEAKGGTGRVAWDEEATTGSKARVCGGRRAARARVCWVFLSKKSGAVQRFHLHEIPEHVISIT